MFLTTSPITFPGLGIEINPPDGFSLFGLEIKFYALIICLGLVLAAVYCMWRCKDFGLSTDDILDVLIVGLPCAIVGARLYYVVFEWETFFVYNEHWYDFLNIRRGGLPSTAVSSALCWVWASSAASAKSTGASSSPPPIWPVWAF